MNQENTAKNQERRDFFISYTGRDRQWAEWMAMQLEQDEKYTVFIQAWDFRPGSNFIAEMDRAAQCAERTLLVLSPAYLESCQTSGYTLAEWAAALRTDPTGRNRRLVPVRIQPCEVHGLLGSVVYIDLVSLDETEACERLLAGVRRGRVKPTTVAFPGKSIPHEPLVSVPFPGSFPALWTLPFPPNPFFTGREALLERLHTQLQTTQTVAVSQPQAISGLGGIGKTQLAIEYAYRFRSEYQAVLWARAETTEALNASYTELASVLQLPEKEAQEQEVIVQAVRNWLRRTNGWLLILDNADDLAVVQPFLPTVCPGHLLLTTRAQIMGKFARRLEVDTLDRQAGALFLLRRAGLLTPDAWLTAASAEDQALALALTEELGGLPLALDQAGAYIEEAQCGLADYSRQYQTRRAELLAHRGMLVDDHPEPVATTWSLSFAKVEAANPLAAEVLRICAFLAPDAIPEEVLEEALKTPLPASDEAAPEDEEGGEFSSLISGQQKKSEPALLRMKEGQMDEAVSLLRAYSLIQRNVQTKTLSIHRLVQAVLRDALEREGKRRAWVKRMVHVVEEALPGITFENWKKCEQYVPHAQECVQLATGMVIVEEARILHWIGAYLLERQRTQEAGRYVQRALTLREQHLGREHLKTAASLDRVARWWELQGKYGQAEPLLVRALAIREQQLGASHPDTATSLNNLAGLYESQGKYGQAEPLFQRALTIREQTLGREHPDTALSVWCLATLFEQQQDYQEAKSLYERALSTYEQTVGSEHQSTQSMRKQYATLLEKMKGEEDVQ